MRLSIETLKPRQARYFEFLHLLIWYVFEKGHWERRHLSNSCTCWAQRHREQKSGVASTTRRGPLDQRRPPAAVALPKRAHANEPRGNEQKRDSGCHCSREIMAPAPPSPGAPSKLPIKTLPTAHEIQRSSCITRPIGISSWWRWLYLHVVLLE